MIYQKINENVLGMITNYVCEFFPSSKLLSYKENSYDKQLLYGIQIYGLSLFISIYHDDLVKIAITGVTSKDTSIKITKLQYTIKEYLTMQFRNIKIKELGIK